MVLSSLNNAAQGLIEVIIRNEKGNVVAAMSKKLDVLEIEAKAMEIVVLFARDVCI